MDHRTRIALTLLPVVFGPAGCGGVAPSAGGPAPVLFQQEWTVIIVDGAETTTEKKPRFTLHPDDRIGGSTGCNVFTGPARVTGDRITLGHLATTRRACAPDVMAQEQRFTEAIADIDGWRFDASGDLVLEAGNRTRIIARR